MSTSINVSLHHLAAADITQVSVYPDEGRRVALVMDCGPQLHWDSFAAFETWVDVLVQRVCEAKQANDATAVAS